MVKKYGLTLGGLQQKILNLVLIFLLAIIAVFGAVSFYQSKTLGDVVSRASDEQQSSIERVSSETMQQVIESSMVKTNALQAYIADDMFSEMKTDTLTLQTLAEELFEHQDSFEPYSFYPPDAANDGEFTAQVLWGEGVDFEHSEYLGVAAHMSDTMIAMCKNSGYLSNVFIGLSDGTLLCVDDQSANKFDENGNIINFNVLDRPWYKGAENAGRLYFTGIEADTYTDKIGIECSAPVYRDGELIGVVGVDLFLDAMSDYVEQSVSNGSFICVVNDNGQMIFAPDGNGLFEVELSDEAADLRSSDNKELADFVTSALKAQTGLKTVTINDKEYYMAGSPMETVGWAVISVIEKQVTEQPTNALLAEYDRINGEAEARFAAGTKRSQQTTLVMIAVILILGTVGALTVAGKIVKPVERMTKRIYEISGTDLAFEMEDIYRTNDEIEVLAESFATLSKRTRNYIDQITKITAEKERIGAELELATKIQADMLPNIFPPYPDRTDFLIFASMTPAKEVGGDFYDFFLIDDDHLGMIIADVSGKGVPAALFMMASKILLENLALGGLEPSEVLTKANEQICKDNKTDMFVTVWYGILEISTGKVKAANAGHEYPVLCKNQIFEIFKDKHGFVLGGMESMRYRQYEFEMNHGDTLFLYTDGVPEATNGQNEMFGTDRLLEALNAVPNAEPKKLLENVTASVDKFVDSVEQFDDLTILCVKRT